MDPGFERNRTLACRVIAVEWREVLAEPVVIRRGYVAAHVSRAEEGELRQLGFEPDLESVLLLPSFRASGGRALHGGFPLSHARPPAGRKVD
jgi:hypothetical protein